MKSILIHIIRQIAKFFNSIIDKEAQRVFEFNRQIFEAKTNKGGEINE